jgi:hypothetical protein
MPWKEFNRGIACLATGHVSEDGELPSKEDVTLWYDKLVLTCRDLYKEGDIKCWVIGLEKGEETNRWHLQCYFGFNQRRNLRWVSQNIYRGACPSEKETIRFGIANGSPQENFDYCSKEGEFQCDGEFSGGQGTRNDLASLRERAEQTAGDPDALLGLYEHHFGSMCRYGRGIKEYQQLVLEKQRREAGFKPPKVYAFIGKSKTGKSRRAYYEASRDYGAKHIFIKSYGSWYDGYRGHKAVIINEFTGNGIPLSEFQQITDGYPYRVPIKNSHHVWWPDVIYITSNVHPDDWWTEARQLAKNAEIWPSIRRRIKVTVFRGEWTPSDDSTSTEEEPVQSGSGGDGQGLDTSGPVARVLAPDTPEIPVVDHENCPHTTLNQEGMDWIEEISDIESSEEEF